MRVLLDINHPAHVHLFKHLIYAIPKGGHEVMVAARDKDVCLELLRDLGIDHICVSRKAGTLAGMSLELLTRTVRLMQLARRFEPDVMAAFEAGVSIGPVGALLKVPRVVFEQADAANLQRFLGLPFATSICTGSGYRHYYGRRQRKFRGFLAQAYLDPRYFTPNPEPLVQAGIDPEKSLIIIRLVKWNAVHDFGRTGPKEEALLAAANRLTRHGRVLISSERPLPPELDKFANPVPARYLHDLLAHASVCVDEGGTVAMEAAILGVPSVSCNFYEYGYLRSLEEDFKLLHRTPNLAGAVELTETYLCDPNIRQKWLKRRDYLFANTDDVNKFVMDTVHEAGMRQQ